MRDDNESRSYVDHLLAEHRRLHQMLRQMRAAILGSVQPDAAPSFAEVARVLARLHDELEHHFAQEEGGGCLDEAVSLCPRLAAEAKRIEAEHPAIMAEVTRLIDLAKTLQPTARNQMTIQHGFDRLYQWLRSHEKAENELLAQGFGMAVNGDESEQAPLILDV